MCPQNNFTAKSYRLSRQPHREQLVTYTMTDPFIKLTIKDNPSLAVIHLTRSSEP